MRIGLDATRIRQPTGEGVYTREVIRSLIKAFPHDHFFVVVPEYIPLFDAPNVEQVLHREIDGIVARLRYAFAIGRIARECRLDIFHNLTNYAAFMVPCPVVTNVMDLVTLRFPLVRANPLHPFIYRYVFPCLLRLSCRLIAISENTKSDVEQFYGLGDRVRVIPCGIDHEQFNTVRTLDPSLTVRFRLPPNYLLFVGYLSPKKNLEIVLRAMHRLSADGFDTHLVLVGKRGDGTQPFFDLARDLGLLGRIVETGYVSNDELTLLYRHAGLVVFPSLYEGFGLPVVEAMACGAPLLISDAGALSELVIDASCLCHPQCLECWTAGIRVAFSDEARRERALIEGPLRARDFSWELGARSLREVYSEVVLEYAGAGQ